jgi:putative spermidine/putrescine transport system ATP-binding protein
MVIQYQAFPPHKRGIGMVFQNYALFPHLSVYENLAFPLKVRKISNDIIDEKVNKTLEMVSLGDFGMRMPAQLSGGQQQRVAVARSLVFDPKLVLMDEPLGALDKNLRESMQYELKHIHESLGVTVVYVTHDQSEALTMSNRIAVFNDGHVQQLSGPNELYETPVNSFVAEFIGENNTITGTVKEISGNQAKVETDKGESVIANPIAVKSVGEKTKMSLRPERVMINPAADLENKFDASVAEIIYHGDHTRVRVNILDDDQFILKIPNSSDDIKLNVNDKIQLGWSSYDCRALDY